MREEQGDVRIQAVSFIWIQRGVAIINVRIPLFPNNGLSPEKLSETVNLNDDVIHQPTQLNYCLVLKHYPPSAYT